MITFDINYHTWKILQVAEKELQEIWQQENDEVCHIFGLTVKSKQTIYINKDMCKEQQIRTLKHELMHAYIWEYGIYNYDEKMNEEFICDLVACSNEFINKIVILYKEFKEEDCKTYKEK